MAATRPSKNKVTINHLKLVCRHVREMREAGISENYAIRILEMFADGYAKGHFGGSASPHHVREVPRRQWSVAAREVWERTRNPKAKDLLRMEHGTPTCDLLHRRLQPFCFLHDCSGCFRLERLPGGACTHWKAPPCHGAHVKRPLRIAAAEVAVEGRAFGIVKARCRMRRPVVATSAVP
jgi:hypothetical protein